MTWDIKDLLALIGLIGSLGIQSWALVRFLINRMDKQDGALHKRVTELGDTSVTRAQHEREFDMINSELRAVRDDMKQYHATMQQQHAELLRALLELSKEHR